jgi:hypothetical protein
MAELKTRPTGRSVAAFLAGMEDEAARKDCRVLVALMRKATGSRPAMWGPSIVGFGSLPLRYASGRELEWPEVAFSPRKRSLTLYLLSRFPGRDALLKKLGKHKTSVSCLYVDRLADLDGKVLKQLVDRSVAEGRKRYPRFVKPSRTGTRRNASPGSGR